MHPTENLMLLIVWMSSRFHAKMWPRLMWWGEVSTNLKKNVTLHLFLGPTGNSGSFRLCVRRSLAEMAEPCWSPILLWDPWDRRNGKRGRWGGVMNFTPIFFPKEEVVGNLKLLSCVQHPRWFQECSSEVSWRAEVFSEISVISSARLGWDDVRVEIAISNLGIQQYNCTISDWSMTFSSKSFWRFLVIYLWTCGILQLYFLDIVLPKAGFQQPRPSREAFSSSSGCSLLFLDPCRYCSVREMPW